MRSEIPKRLAISSLAQPFQEMHQERLPGIQRQAVEHERDLLQGFEGQQDLLRRLLAAFQQVDGQRQFRRYASSIWRRRARSMIRWRAVVVRNARGSRMPPNASRDARMRTRRCHGEIRRVLRATELLRSQPNNQPWCSA
ncbi:unnamed protein product, partial [Mesorhabditis spiculigera]